MSASPEPMLIANSLSRRLMDVIRLTGGLIMTAR
jgi:hypothetical protein